MPCCAESGEIFIFPSGGAVPDFPPYGEHGLPTASSFDEVLEAALEEGELFSPKLRNLPRPWVARVAEEEVDEWVERLNSTTAVEVACPNWRLSLSRSAHTAAAQEGFDPTRAADWIRRHGGGGSPGEGDGLHVAVLDSGVAPSAVCCGKLNEPQIDLTQLGVELLTPPYDRVGHGSLVAALIHRLAPGASITSIRAFRHGTATLSDLVYALLCLGLFRAPVHLANLSFSIDATGDPCPNCGYERPGKEARLQLGSILDLLASFGAQMPLLVAAAGTRSRLPAPAGIARVIAVDTFDGSNLIEPGRRQAQDGERVILAAGGSGGEPIEKGVYGSSFAAAVATGTLARSGQRMLDVWRTPWAKREGAQRRLLEELACRDFEGYERKKHGFGVLG
jgi:hypothetical protein